MQPGWQQPPPGYGGGGGYGGSPYTQQPQVPTNVYGAPGAGYEDPTLRAWFNAVDRDRSGYISTYELQSALSSGGHNFSVSVAEKLIRMFDKSGRGSINFSDYQELHKFINAMVQGFRSRDTSGDGRLDGREIRAALQASGYHLNEQAFSLMMRKFDTQHRGSLSLDDYIDLSISIGSASKVFGFYDQQHAGYVTFDFNNFFIASLSMK